MLHKAQLLEMHVDSNWRGSQIPPLIFLVVCFRYFLWLNFLVLILRTGSFTYFIHTVRQVAVQTADASAKRGRDQHRILETYDTCPPFVCPAIVWHIRQIRWGPVDFCPLDHFHLWIKINQHKIIIKNFSIR